jgi:dolichol-phosphate mannosyltransferase
MLYFLIPVYNEALNMADLASSLVGILPEEKKFFVFVDDASTDDTVAQIRRLFPASALTILQKEKNAGPGDSFNLGMDWILENNLDEEALLVSIEGDNTSDLAILPQLIDSVRQGNDVALASVYLDGGRFEQTSWFKKVVSGIANTSIRLAFGLKIHTLSSFYRVYSLGILRRVKRQYGMLIAETGFVCMVELIVKIVGAGGKVVEIPTVLHSSRRKGSSKMNMLRTTFGYLRFIVRQLGRRT